MYVKSFVTLSLLEMNDDDMKINSIKHGISLGDKLDVFELFCASLSVGSQKCTKVLRINYNVPRDKEVKKKNKWQMLKLIKIWDTFS